MHKHHTSGKEGDHPGASHQEPHQEPQKIGNEAQQEADHAGQIIQYYIIITHPFLHIEL